LARARIATPGASSTLAGEWALTSTAPGVRHPDDLEAAKPDWIACDGPMTAAAALRAAGRWTPGHPRDFDAETWWFRCRFAAAPARSLRMVFEGLATIADVWLNRQHVLRSNNMFVTHAVDVTTSAAADNELLLCFHALSPLLDARHPRPGWRTALVSHQALRFYRTTLLGRIREWCPQVAPAGPWRAIRVESGPLHVDGADVRTELEGTDGLVHVVLRLSGAFAGDVTGHIRSGAATADFAVRNRRPGSCELVASLRMKAAARWWPHTHGCPHRYPLEAVVTAGAEPTGIALGRVGFRTLHIDRGRDGSAFGVVVNETPVFCRGVCWTPLDLVRLSAGEAEYRAALEQIRDAGMNMIRIGGTMAYEPDVFHDLCSELGILVWQDLMFANMDYPWSDVAFAETASHEVVEVVSSLQAHPSSAIVCGNSEVEQQAAMLGLPAERRPADAVAERLAGIVEAASPSIVWLPSTPTGGTFPFQPAAGVSHYYGVGAYRRSFDDARRAQVRFAAECLGFSNVPEPAAIAPMVASAALDSTWKSGVPRDPGASWDFEDVRDHYVAALFAVDPSAIRAADPERYLTLGRMATGEAMVRTFSEWRRPGSTCRGGLVWFARDLRPGAGWGIIDATGGPKSVYWYLKRVLAPVALLAIDEGLNGLWLHAVNDTDVPIEGSLCVSAYRDGLRSGVPVRAPIDVPARGARSIHADALFDGFRDLTYAYRFGPPPQDAVCASLRDSAGAVIARACWTLDGRPPAGTRVELRARVEREDGSDVLVLDADRFVQAVTIDVQDFVPADNYLHLEPGEPVRVPLRPLSPGAAPRGVVRAVTSSDSVAVTFAQPLEVD
jgi:beta-mannosidase